MRAFLALFALSLIFVTTARGGTLVDRVVATVGDSIILLSEVDALLSFGLEEELDTLPQGEERDARHKELRRQSLDQLIGEKLIEQTIQTDGIRITDEEVERQTRQIATENKLTMEQLKEALLRDGMTWEGYQSELRRQMERQRFIGFEISSRVVVDETRIEEEYAARKAQAEAKILFHLQRIRVSALAPVDPDAAEQPDASTPMLQVLAAIEAGEEFDAVARRLSDLPDAATEGSDAGTLDPATLAPAFRDALDGLQQGQISQPILQGDSQWLFRVVSIEHPTYPPIEQLRDALMDELWQQEIEHQLARWVERKKARAHIEVLL